MTVFFQDSGFVLFTAVSAVPKFTRCLVNISERANNELISSSILQMSLEAGFQNMKGYDLVEKRGKGIPDRGHVIYQDKT